jgi:hypothetical protein
MDYRFSDACFVHAGKNRTILRCPLCKSTAVKIENATASENCVIISMCCGEYDNHAWDIVISQDGYSVEIISRDTRAPLVCKKCGAPITNRNYEYCRDCYNDIFYDGVPLQRCRHILKSGIQCAQKGHLKDGLCWLHKHKYPP